MKKIGIIGTTLLLFSLESAGYRFICNGILATGEVRGDECGLCDDDHAARWEDPTISVVVDGNTVPNGLKKSDWQQAVKQSFAAWESIGGSNLKFVQKNEGNRREFGANDSLHEIFWITKKEEWRKLVGSGEFGTLGATLPRYSCAEKGQSKRVIFDADLVLNGLSHINWQMACHDDDCISIQTTLVHELGHFFGLDHPCLMCSSSIMSARAGYNLTYPALDDIEGLRALYPDGKKGEFGSPCKDDADCSEVNRCVVDAPHKYCSKDCSHDGECDLGSICKAHEQGKVCGFNNEEIAGVKEGDNCMRAPCAEPMVCAGASEPNFYCYMPCRTDRDCKSSQSCINVDDGTGVCVLIKHKGEPCNHRDLCEEDLYCVFDKLTSGLCHAPCKTRKKAGSRCGLDENCEMIEGTEICVSKKLQLALDESAIDDFAPQEPSDSLGKNKGSTERQYDGGGCSSVPEKNGAGLQLVVVALAFFTARMIRRRHLSL